MNELQIFKNEEFGQVRTLIIDGEPYFVAKDISEKLNYSETSVMLRRLDEDEMLKIEPTEIVGANSKAREMTVINESGLFNATLGSKLPSAKKFKKWITSEVLPTIRKTGGYVNNDDAFIRTYLPFADDITKEMFKSTLQTVRKQNELIVKQQEEITHKEDVIIGLVDQVTLADKRQILNRVVRYKGANFQERWRELYRQFSMKYHIDLTKRFESYNLSHKPKVKSKVDYIDKVMNKIPELYEIACKLYENDVKELASQIYQLN
jgi:prophage antirepressor-like protein